MIYKNMLADVFKFSKTPTFILFYFLKMHFHSYILRIAHLTLLVNKI